MKGLKRIAAGMLIASLLCSSMSPMAVMAEDISAPQNTSEAKEITDTVEESVPAPEVAEREEIQKEENLPEEVEKTEPAEETNSKQDMPVTEAHPRDGTDAEVENSIEDEVQTYRIQVEADSASYEVSSEQAIPGEDVHVSATAEEGYHIRAMAAYGTEGEVVAGTIDGQVLSFSMPEQDIKVIVYTSPNYVETILRSGIRVRRSTGEFLSGDIVQWVGREVTGKANIGGYMSEGAPLESYFEVSGLEEIGFYGTVTMDSRAIWCRNHGAAEPSNVEADLWAKCTRIENGMAYYDLILTPPGATDAEIDIGWDYITGYQKIGSNAFAVPVVESNGSLQMKKVSSNPELTQGNSCYSLEGAVYKVYEDEQLTKEVATLTTDSNGNSNTVSLKKGKYFAKEVSASKGYHVSEKVHRVDVETGKTASFTSIERPKNDPIQILINKIDSETGKANPLGKGTLGDAQFTIKFYSGTYNSINDLTGKIPTRVWVYKTNSQGKVRLTEDYKISGDELYKTETGIVTMPMGAITIQETKAPSGYLVSDEVFFRAITPEGRVEGVSTFQTPIVKEQVIRGGVAIEKWDSETNRRKAQGGATLAGTQIEIISLNENAVYVGGVEYQKNEVIDRITTNEQGVAETTADRYPYGDYLAREAVPPTGYLETGAVERPFSIRKNGEIVRLNTSDKAIKNEVIRGDLQLVKFQTTDEEEDQKKPLKGIIFEITSKTTKKTVEIVTDKNGYASTKQVNISPRGNLVYDTYIVHEKNPPVGVKPVRDFEITIRNEGETLYYILDNKTIISPVRLVKLDAETGKIIPLANAEFQLLDKNKNPIEMVTHYPTEVTHKTYKTDQSGTFTLPKKLPASTYYFRELHAPRGYLLSSTDIRFEIKEGHDWEDPVLVEVSNHPAKGKIEIRKVEEGTGKGLKGATFSVEAMEDIAAPDGTVRARAGEIVDTVETDQDGRAESKLLYLGKYLVQEKQQPARYIRTKTAWEIELKYEDQLSTIVMEQLKVENKPTEIQIKKTDAESGNGLQGVTFKMWKKEAEEKTEEYVTDENGEIKIQRLASGIYCFQETRTVPGYVRSDQVFEIVIDEDGRIDGKDVGSLNIANVRTKLIGTTVKDKDTKTQKSVPKENVTFIDTVEFKNLQIGQTYTIKGKLMDKSTGKPLLINGKEVTAEKTFQAEHSDGTVDVEFVFDGSALKGKQIVVFEKVYTEEQEILSHEDLEDQGQTIEFPDSKIGTTVKDKDTKTQESIPKKKVTFLDKVAYKNLIAGQEYTAKGTLMDKSTGKPLLINGKEVTAEKTFHPEEPDGSVEVEFVFDGSALKGKQIVVFEKLYVQEIEVAAHEELEDRDQTMEFPDSKIGTTAKDKATGTKEVIAKEAVTIVDTVKYENLIVGQTYLLKGILMDKSTGKPLLINEKEVTAEKTFQPEEPNGSMDMEFTFDASALKGKQVVVFEKLLADGVEVAVHEDLHDEGQTIQVKLGGLKVTLPNQKNSGKILKISGVKTGDTIQVWQYLLGFFLSGIVILSGWKRRRDAN